MSKLFPVHLPLEQAYSRKVLFAAEILDAVTLEPVTREVEVRATGLNNRPIVNAGAFFVWLEEGARQAQQVIVDASATQYESRDVPAPVPPARHVRIELAPKYGYPFPPGVTALRGTLIESPIGTRTAVAGAEIWLQWIDDTVAGTNWVDAPTKSHSAANGDFAALLRPTPAQIPRLDPSGSLAVRLRVDREGTTRTSLEFSLQQGRVTGGLPPFAWSDLVP
jgi:hypothetical protein